MTSFLGRATAPRIKWQKVPEESDGELGQDVARGPVSNIKSLVLKTFDSQTTPGPQQYASVCCCICLAVVVLLFVVSTFRASAITKSVILSQAHRILGVDVEVGDVSVGIFDAETSVSDVMVANPNGYVGDFLQLRKGLVDTTLWSLLSHHVELEEVALNNIDVYLEQADLPFAIPNFVPIMRNIVEAKMHPPNHTIPGFLGGKIASRLFTLDRLEMTQLTVHMNMKGLQGTLGLEMSPGNGPLNHTINRIQVKNIGKKRGGVHVPELVYIIVNAILGAAVQEAPGEVAQAMLAALSGAEGLGSLDFESLHLDIGSGLQQIATLLDRLRNGFGVTGQPTGPVVANAAPSAMMNTTPAFTGDGSPSTVGTLASTATAFDNALETAAVRAEHNGIFGKFVSNALNSTEALSDNVFDIPTTVTTTIVSDSRQCAKCLKKCARKDSGRCRQTLCARFCGGSSPGKVTTGPGTHVEDGSTPTNSKAHAVNSTARTIEHLESVVNKTETAFGSVAHNALKELAERMETRGKGSFMANLFTAAANGTNAA